MDGRITLQKLEIFVLVADLGNVTRAAEQLFLAQPVVSGHLRSLETRVGAKLLRREPRSMVLTPQGERVYRWALETLTRGRELSRELEGLANGDEGSAVVAASMSFGSYVLPSILPEFLATRPHAHVSVKISSPEAALDSISGGRSDLAVIVGDRSPVMGDIDSKHLYDEDLVVVTGGDNPRAHLVVGDLATVPFVCSPAGSYRREINDRSLRSLGVTHRNIVLELEHPEAIKQVVSSGLGVAMLLRSSVADDLANGRLQDVSAAGMNLHTPVFLYRKPPARTSAMQEALISHIVAACHGNDTPL